MAFSGLSLQKISHLVSPKDLATLEQMPVAENAFRILKKMSLDSHNIQKKEDGGLEIQFVYAEESSLRKSYVQVEEDGEGGELTFHCAQCAVSRKDKEDICVHEWASLILIWWALSVDRGFLRNHSFQVSNFCEDFWDLTETKKAHRGEGDGKGLPDNLKLESISLVTETLSLDEDRALEEYLPEWNKVYELNRVPEGDDASTGAVWGLPQAFRGSLQKETVYWADVRHQDQLAGLLRYNFNDGVQISSRDILRHAYRSVVPRDLLPGPARKETFEVYWPLLPSDPHRFFSRDLLDIEAVMQELLSRITRRVNKGDLKFYLQDQKDLGKAFQVGNISVEAEDAFEWKVEFSGSDEVKTSALLTAQKDQQKYIFFDNFAVDFTTGAVVAFAWKKESEALDQFYSRQLKTDRPRAFSHLHVEGKGETAAFMKFLRGRSLPVRVQGGSHDMGAIASVLNLHHQDDAGFVPEKVFTLNEKETVSKMGFSTPVVLIMRTLQEGLGFLLQTEVKTLASSSFKKREWDLKILKHLGVLQYLTLEALTYHFEGQLTDGTTCDPANIFPALRSRVHSLLVTGDGTSLTKTLDLDELCSKGVLGIFADYVAKVLKSVGEREAIYSSKGEYLFSGSVEREFRVLYEILKYMALSTQGSAFKRARTGFLTKTWDGKLEEDPMLEQGHFFMPSWGKEDVTPTQSLGLLQPLVDHGIRLYVRGQLLQELGQNEFVVDFQIVSKLDEGMLNWFELNPRFFLQGKEIDATQLKSMGSGGVVEYDGKFFLVPRKEIPSLRRLEGFWQKLQAGKKDSSKKAWTDKYYQLPKHQALELLALRASGYAFRGDEEWKRICAFYDGLGTRTDLVKLPGSVKAELKTYQHEGVQWLLDLFTLRMGALLADDMGLGKTLQALSFLDLLRTREQLGQVLVVVPSSLVYNWESEVAKFTPELPFEIFTSKDHDRLGKRLEAKEPLVVVTTYGLLMENDEFLSQYNWNVLIFDEAQNLKNITAKRTSSARMLNARFKMCLTGTPMENHFGEFYSLLDLVVPGCLGKYDDFRRHFVNTEVVLLEDVEDLKLKTRPLIMRRTKKEILDQLPEKQETKVSIAFEDKQKQIYRDIAIAYNQRIQDTIREAGESQSQLQMLTALLRLRQACSDPGALPEVKYEKTPPKLEALMDSLQEIIESGESALVFTQFLQTLERTEKLLKAVGIPVFVLHGAIPTKQRQKILKDFNETKGGAVLVMTLKTGGVGLNLTKASYVFHLEPWWNPSVENQATDRAHRLGQRKAVQVFRYIMHESLEEKMELLKERKNRKFQSLFSETEASTDLTGAGGALTKEDFDFLLGLK
ncbi:putative helicase/SNF2 family domain protein [Bdellovibrio bacteriovorus HD100]|uniref:Putative helicase/SNF2 family domain protein n=2 Tax=Bdellovibrio bacteriovorus TaxID=959 RepID=Q6MMG5_BDEBA|nr:putative helicase/SNF2 family domain protein [Bdellovibrio bacteriovorus HD100]